MESEIRFDENGIYIKNGQTEITAREDAISVLAPQISLESGKQYHQFCNGKSIQKGRI